jgi:hypothetical protein
LGSKIAGDTLHRRILGQVAIFGVLRKIDVEFLRNFAKRFEDAGSLLFDQKINLKVEVISPLFVDRCG